MIKQWSRDYTWSIAMDIGLLISFGWRYWYHFHIKKTERASQLYIQLQALTSQHELGKTNQLTNQLVKKYAKTPYGMMASLLNAKNAVAQKICRGAKTIALGYMDNAAPPLQQIARLRAARIYLAQNQPNQALDLLQTINDFTFNPLIEKILKVIFMP